MMKEHDTWPTTQGESLELIELCASLKKRLTEYAYETLGDVIRRMGGERVGRSISEHEATMIVEDTIYTTTLPSGDSVFEDFALYLPEAERRIVLGWSDWIFGVFEARDVQLPFIQAHNLVDDLDYRLFATNMTAEVRDRFSPGVYILSRAARVRDAWMLSGMQSVHRASERQKALGLAATLSMQMPPMFFRNPVHVERGRELDRRSHERFLERFGAPWIVGPPTEVLRRYNELLVPESARASGTGTSADLGFSPELCSFRTVGVVSDPFHGVFFVPDFDQFLDALDAPANWGDPKTKEILVDFLQGAGSTPATFGACASYRPQQLDAMLAAVFGRSGFSWTEHGEALLRKHNPGFLDGDPMPSNISLGSEMAQAYGAMLDERSRGTSGSDGFARDKRARNKAKAARRKNRR